MKYEKKDIDYLINVALSAGNKIMQIYNSQYSIEFKQDDSPLTLADTLADQIISESIHRQYPDIYYLSEETLDNQSQQVNTFFLVDPLDGTKEFIKKNGEFTVNIALIVNSRLELGIVYAPALDQLFYGSKQFGAYKVITNNHSLTEKIVQLNTAINYSGPLRVVASRSHASDDLNAWLSNLEQDYELKNYGSSLKFCRVAEGDADVYPRFGLTSQWDTAAGQCILECVGGEVLDHENSVLEYGLDRPILNPNFIAYRNPLKHSQRYHD